MVRPEILGEQLIVHRFFPLDGPAAAAAQDQVRAAWAACRRVFMMTDPVPGTGLPDHLPDYLMDRMPPGGEVPLAAQQRPDGGCQAILRRHHDALDLSVALAPDTVGGATSDDGARSPRPGTGPGWSDLHDRWRTVGGAAGDAVLGEVEIYLAAVTPAPADLAADAAASLGRTLAAALPPAPAVANWWQRPVRAGAMLLWEASAGEETQAGRRFVVAVSDTEDPDLGSLIWSDGSTAIPPLARYLLQAAKVRYQLRVWQRDRAALVAQRPIRADSAVPLRQMRRTVQIAQANMASVVDRLGPVESADTFSGLFDEDRALTEWFVDQLDDDAHYQSLRAAQEVETYQGQVPAGRPEAAAGSTGTGSTGTGSTGTVVTAPVVTADDPDRGVFVIHGRDDELRDRMFDFLRALDLRPLEWESLVAASGSAAPYLGDVVGRAVRLARAAVVLMTPDDEVCLHPSLRLPSDADIEAKPGMQARPNVLLEMGMALATYPTRTLVIQVGDLRPVADLGGVNFIRLNDGPDCRRKIALRLRQSGCPVDDRGSDWLAPGRFADLAAYRRRVGPSPDDAR